MATRAGDGEHGGGSEAAAGPELARLNAFSDGVFALSATLLVVTLEVPTSYDALLDALRGFLAFFLAFAALVSLWFNHRGFFARYRLGDGLTVALNALLLFVVLLYVYPLKLLTEVVSEQFLWARPDVTVGMGRPETQGLFLVYGAGFAAVFALYTALHARAWLLRARLGLGERAAEELRRDIVILTAIAGVGVVSMVAAAAGLGLGWGLPFWIYVLAPLAVVAQRLLAHGAGDRG